MNEIVKFEFEEKQLEILQQTINLLIELEKKQLCNIEERIKAIEKHPVINNEIENTEDENYIIVFLTVKEFCNAIDKKVTSAQLKKYAKECKYISYCMGFQIKKRKDGDRLINRYSLALLEEVILHKYTAYE
jgi:predicted nucleic acid-binding protein